MTDATLERIVEAIDGRFFGKYRGEVVKNTDTGGSGRLEVKVPTVLGDKSITAMPCLPYAGDQVGFFALPPENAKIWVEFEGGDTDLPIWSGCYWADGQIAQGDDDPSISFLRTSKIDIRIDSENGEIEIKTAGGASLLITGDEIVLDAPKITQTANGASAELAADGFDAMGGALKVS